MAHELDHLGAAQAIGGNRGIHILLELGAGDVPVDGKQAAQAIQGIGILVDPAADIILYRRDLAGEHQARMLVIVAAEIIPQQQSCDQRHGQYRIGGAIPGQFRGNAL